MKKKHKKRVIRHGELHALWTSRDADGKTNNEYVRELSAHETL